MNLRELKVGESAKILAVHGEGELRQHFLDMGLIPFIKSRPCVHGRLFRPTHYFL